MEICKCAHITDDQIRTCGTQNYFEVCKLTGAGRTCGSCAPKIVQVLNALTSTFTTTVGTDADK